MGLVRGGVGPVRRLPPPPDTPAQRRMFAARHLLAYLPWGFLYPLQVAALSVLVFVSLGLWYFAQNAFAVMILSLFVAASMHYAFLVLERSALGHADAPPLGAFGFLRWDWRSIVLVLFIAFVLTCAERLQRSFGDAPAVVWCVMWCALLPGVVVRLALEEDLAEALKPGELLSLLLHGGLAYWVAAIIFSAALFLFMREFLAFFSRDLRSWLEVVMHGRGPATLGFLFVVLYAVTVVMHLFGNAVWRRRAELGIETSVEPPTPEAVAQTRWVRRVNGLFERIDKLVDREEHEAAESELLTASLEAAEPLTELELMFELARRRKRNYLIIVAGQRYIEALLEADRDLEAATAAELCLDRYPRFETFRPAHTVRMAQAALAAGRQRLFERLVSDFATRHPGAAAERVEVAWLVARQRVDRDGDDAGALALLRAQPPHPDPQREAQRRAYEAALERILTPARRP
jgi:hypothetical protein